MSQANDYNTENLQPTATMLDENLYWQLVEESLQHSSTQEEQQIFLINRLQQLSPEAIIGFRLQTDKLLYDTYNAEMWCAAFIMNQGCSDDGFEYFRNWVISRGKDVYYKAKENPDSLVEQLNNDLEYYDFEMFWYVALDAFEHKTGKNLYDYIDYKNFHFGEMNYQGFEFTWSPTILIA